ncbi:MAG: GNAT family N-acetyltransferase [Candidatus Rokuibacteriota bacterium]
MKVHLHDRLEAVDPGAWHALHAATRLRSPFLTWTWQREWVRAFAEDRRLQIRGVEDERGRLTAILPLYETGAGLWRLIGGLDVSDYLDLLAEAGGEEEAWRMLLEARAPEDGVWDLHSVPAASPTVLALPALARAAGLAASVAVEERCPILALPPSWETYLGTLPGKHRHELLRKIRRLEREAPEVRAVSCSGRTEVEARLGDFLVLHRASRAGKARFMDARMETFFRRATVALAADGAVRLWFLETAGGPAAAFITLEWDGNVGLYNSGFDPGRAALSPGLVLLARLVEDAIARGKRRFDFLRGEERYKYEFGPTPEDVCTVTLTPAMSGQA